MSLQAVLIMVWIVIDYLEYRNPIQADKISLLLKISIYLKILLIQKSDSILRLITWQLSKLWRCKMLLIITINSNNHTELCFLNNQTYMVIQFNHSDQYFSQIIWGFLQEILDSNLKYKTNNILDYSSNNLCKQVATTLLQIHQDKIQVRTKRKSKWILPKNHWILLIKAKCKNIFS
jgi:hypothetical protein